MLAFVENTSSASWQNRWERTAYGLWGSVAFVALVFTLRGLTGAFDQEISPLAACVGALVAAGVCFGAWGIYRAAFPQGFSPWQMRLAFAGTVIPPLLLGVVLCPASSSLGIAWMTVLGIGLALSVQLMAPSKALPECVEDDSDSEATITAIFPAAFKEPDLTQWMTRRTLRIEGESWEQIEGQSSVEFIAGQQHATMHLSICPPLSSTPEIECETKGDADVEWKVAALHPYGVRLELRRPSPTTETLAVTVGYTMAAQIPTELAKAA